MYHKIIIVGNLGNDPEMRYTPDGTPVTNFSVATNYRRNRPDGTQYEETTWFRVTTWRQLAETCNQYLSKGRQVYVEGKLQTRSWEKDGVTRYTTEIVASDVQFLGGRNAAVTFRSSESAPSQGHKEPQLTDRHDDDIPF